MSAAAESMSVWCRCTLCKDGASARREKPTTAQVPTPPTRADEFSELLFSPFLQPVCGFTVAHLERRASMEQSSPGQAGSPRDSGRRRACGFNEARGGGDGGAVEGREIKKNSRDVLRWVRATERGEPGKSGRGRARTEFLEGRMKQAGEVEVEGEGKTGARGEQTDEGLWPRF